MTFFNEWISLKVYFYCDMYCNYSFVMNYRGWSIFKSWGMVTPHLLEYLIIIEEELKNKFTVNEISILATLLRLLSIKHERLNPFFSLIYFDDIVFFKNLAVKVVTFHLLYIFLSHYWNSKFLEWSNAKALLINYTLKLYTTLMNLGCFLSVYQINFISDKFYQLKLEKRQTQNKSKTQNYCCGNKWMPLAKNLPILVN